MAEGGTILADRLHYSVKSASIRKRVFTREIGGGWRRRSFGGSQLHASKDRTLWRKTPRGIVINTQTMLVHSRFQGVHAVWLTLKVAKTRKHMQVPIPCTSHVLAWYTRVLAFNRSVHDASQERWL